MQNFIKTIINGVQKWTKKEIKQINNRISGSQADWNQNDENADSYIKNRPFYKGYKVLFDGSFVAAAKNPELSWETVGYTDAIVRFEFGETYIVDFDGVEYITTAKDYDAEGVLVIDNDSKIQISDYFGEGLIIYNAPAGAHTLKIRKPNYFKIDEKYLPDNLATTDDVEEAVEIAQSIADGKMDANNPVGTGSFSMNRVSGSAVGYNSHAEGTNIIASGYASHAEGCYTRATSDTTLIATTTNTTTAGYAAHAEGYGTVACGAISHAEGEGTKASGRRAHAEGYRTTAGGEASHAEGSSTSANGSGSHAEGGGTSANGSCSHAEGDYTEASASCSHAEGDHTIAASERQHVQGKFNIKDNTNTYAHIVGNGIQTKRSNAHTLDWNGVGWFQGGLQVGGNAQDDGAKNVLLEGDAIKLDRITATLPAKAKWRLVYGNGKFVAVANGVTDGSNIAAYSEDGITWKQATLPATAAWMSITYGNGKFVAVAASGSNIAAYSEDGITWKQATLPASDNWKVAYGNGKFVAVAYGSVITSGSNIAAYSEDGITWEQTTLPATAVWVSITYGNGKFVAVPSGSNIEVYSEDGITWEQTTSPAYYCSGVIYGNGKFIASISMSNVLSYSEDGITWKQATLPASGNWRVAYGNGKFVAINDDNNTKTLDIAAYSEDGITWTQTTQIHNSIIDLTYGNGKFVAVAHNKNIVSYSEDGINWHNAYEALFQGDEDVTNKVRDFILPISSATTGQTIVVKSVDENGKPAEWGTIALPSIDGLATEEYVDTSIANLVDSAPETLNTLNELATAIQENDNVIDTLNAAITNKITVPQDAVAGDLLTYDGTNWVRISRADLIAEIIAALPRAEEATF